MNKKKDKTASRFAKIGGIVLSIIGVITAIQKNNSSSSNKS